MSARRRDESRRSTQECVRHEGVFMTFGGPAGPWKLPYGRGSVTLSQRETFFLSRERERPVP
jgi:hypothetical protein